MFQSLIKKIALKLNEKNIPYIIIGGQAVLLYGEPRLTRDIDITLGFGADKYKEIIDIVKQLNFKVLVDDPSSFISQFMVLPVIDENSGTKIDFIFSFSVYEQKAIDRANKINIDGIEVNFSSLEDVLIHKVIAGRARDLEDIKNILLKNKKIDKEYVLKWLTDFDRSLDESFVIRFENVAKEIN